MMRIIETQLLLGKLPFSNHPGILTLKSTKGKLNQPLTPPTGSQTTHGRQYFQ
jgi:hypothetical protein